MNLTSRAGRRLAAGIALASSAILLPAAALAASAAAGTPGHPAAAVLPMAGSADGAAAHPQRRQLAATTLTGSFKVVLTATRSPGSGPAPAATVTAAAYRHTSRGWKLIAAKRIGRGRGWVWVLGGGGRLNRTPPRARDRPTSCKQHDHCEPADHSGAGMLEDLHQALVITMTLVVRAGCLSAFGHRLSWDRQVIRSWTVLAAEPSGAELEPAGGRAGWPGFGTKVPRRAG